MSGGNGDFGQAEPQPGDGGVGFAIRPHPLFVLFFPLRQYLGIVMVTFCVWLGVMVWRWAGLSPSVPGGWSGSWFGGQHWPLFVGGAVLLVRIIWAVLQWATRSYGITDDHGIVRLWSSFGVLNRRRNEVGVEVLRSVSVDRPFFQRIFGLGTIGFATAGTAGFEVVWVIVGTPDELARRVRLAGVSDGSEDDQGSSRQGVVL